MLAISIPSRAQAARQTPEETALIIDINEGDLLTAQAGGDIGKACPAKCR
jgi:hypothetical protein